MRMLRRTALAALGTFLSSPLVAVTALADVANVAPPGIVMTAPGTASASGHLPGAVSGFHATSATAVRTATEAPTSYRYWGYYQWTDGAWTFATAGPAETVPPDGATEGWRFAVTDETSTRYPRTDSDVFGKICSGDPAAGNKQVAVVVDYGTGDDAPDGATPDQARGECAEVPADASGADVLAAVAEVRLDDSGLTCSLDGYPATGCGDAVEGAAPAGPEQPVELAVPAQPSMEPGVAPTIDSETSAGGNGVSSSTWAIVAGIAAIILIGTTALLRSRRSRPE